MAKAHTHRDLCKITARYLLKQSWCDLVSWELQWDQGFADVVGLTTKPNKRNPRITVVEVKRTRQDLLQDLRKQKLRKYENNSTHCTLAATRAALGWKPRMKLATVLKDLRKKGLPDYWGIVVLPESVMLNQGPLGLRSALGASTIPFEEI